ncbi:MAG: L,D-transpeptidase, partial [Actinomycetota bacterium]|nr:L,D-transpeptidase [Actinomycetota bacterium]
RVLLTGTVPIAGPNQWVTVTVRREGTKVLSRRVPANPASRRYRLRLRLRGCCDYVAQAAHVTGVSDPISFEVRGPPTLEDGPQARLFNQLLREHGYHLDTVSAEVDEGTGLGIMALRKVNELPLSEDYAPKLFELLLEGDGAFEPAHREDGRHVEVDLSRQVMALVEDGDATDVFHVSTGAFGTPTGEYSFYDKGPGYNAKGMYYSVYYSGNYATHGYSSVPTYPASHGCVRNPMPYAVFIYDWISLGDKIYVYE